MQQTKHSSLRKLNTSIKQKEKNKPRVCKKETVKKRHSRFYANKEENQKELLTATTADLLSTYGPLPFSFLCVLK